jgi:alcohol dehydrogenase
VDAANSEQASARLAERLRTLATLGGLPARLGPEGVEQNALPALAEDAAQQWTGKFNPRPLTAAHALEVYRCAF